MGKFDKNISDEDRIRQFFIFCKELEKHPILLKYRDGGKSNLKIQVDENSQIHSSLSFDTYHLENLLGRLRQVIGVYELFYHKKLLASAVCLYGESDKLKHTFQKFESALNKKQSSGNIKAYKANAEDLIEGHSILELIEAFLYNGPLHSERKVNGTKASAGLSDSHESVQDHLKFYLLDVGIQFTGFMFRFRRVILESARTAGKTQEIKELSDLDEWSKTQEVLELVKTPGR